MFQQYAQVEILMVEMSSIQNIPPVEDSTVDDDHRLHHSCHSYNVQSVSYLSLSQREIMVTSDSKSPF